MTTPLRHHNRLQAPPGLPKHSYWVSCPPCLPLSSPRTSALAYWTPRMPSVARGVFRRHLRWIVTTRGPSYYRTHCHKNHFLTLSPPPTLPRPPNSPRPHFFFTHFRIPPLNDRHEHHHYSYRYAWHAVVRLPFVEERDIFAALREHSPSTTDSIPLPTKNLIEGHFLCDALIVVCEKS
jgi:hypothetical protein